MSHPVLEHPGSPVKVSRSAPEMPRHRAIYEALLGEIHSGLYKPGDRLPSEAALCERFDSSRITVAKAVQTLQREHLVTRRPGSGTYVEAPPTLVPALQFGLLIPDLGGTEIFEPICRGIMRSPDASSHSLTWGHSAAQHETPQNSAVRLCRQYIAQKVDGVFFAPTEFSDTKDETNHLIASLLTDAGIPIVLLDRPIELHPAQVLYDLVGIDNHRAGYLATRHLISVGAKRIVFAMRRNSAATVDSRAVGYRAALFDHEVGHAGIVVTGDFEDETWVHSVLKTHHPDAFVCGNDVTAARLMKTLIALGIRIPQDIRMVGFDDVRYAKFLPVPLTTIRQDCGAIGVAAMATMLDRLRHPERPAREVCVNCELIVRNSTSTA